MSRYAAFISYSHADAKIARWLHHAVETYRIPRALVGSSSPFGPVGRRLSPVFRDRDELPASSDLGAELRSALAGSRVQLVLCSPRAARSKWVNEEILSFKRIHGEDRTLALIVAGEPYAHDQSECFPPALRFRLDGEGRLSDQPAEPIAADIRPGKDGRRLALLKLVAGIAGVPLAALVRRDAARRQRRLAWVAAVSLAIASVTIGLAVYAEVQRRAAERQRQLADRSLDFLIGTFAIANPATENPRSITALAILDRASRRAAAELPEEPAVSARLLRATGEIYFNLGLHRESERDLDLALRRLPAPGEERTRTALALARLAYDRRDLHASEAAIALAGQSYRAGSTDAREIDAEIRERQGMTAILAGHYAVAADLLEQAARRYAAAGGDHRLEIGRARINEAETLVRLGRVREAETLFSAATAIFLDKYGRDHVLTAGAIRNQALADFESGRLGIADRRIDNALAIYRHVLEPDHPTVGKALVLKGRILEAAGEHDRALAVLDQARTLFVRLYGAGSTEVADVDYYSAEAEAAAGRTDAALARIGRVKAIYDRKYGPDDPDQAELLMLRARTLAIGRRFTPARQACDAGVALRLRLDHTDPAIAPARRRCAIMTACEKAGESSLCVATNFR